MVWRVIPKKFCKWSTKRNSTKWIINEPEKTFNDAVYPRIPFVIRKKPYRLKVPEKFGNNPSGQLYGQAITVTKLFQKERILLSFNRATEIRPHVERLIVEAMRYGDKHRPTMALANFWLTDKSMIHKLFKELVPRYQDYPSAFTSVHYLTPDYSYYGMSMTEIKEKKKKGEFGYDPKRMDVVLELRGNDLPSVPRIKLNRSELLTNVLLSGVREQKELDIKNR